MAADHEDAAEKHSVTPGAVRPARELLGDLLMEMHEPKEALRAYRQVLTVAPERRNALRGVAEAERTLAKSSKINRRPRTRTAGEAPGTRNLAHEILPMGR